MFICLKKGETISSLLNSREILYRVQTNSLPDVQHEHLIPISNDRYLDDLKVKSR